MKPYYDVDGITIYLGDCRDVLGHFPSCFAVDAVITDPPYGVGFAYPSHKDSVEGYGEVLARLFEAESRVVDGWCCVFQAAKYARRWHEWFPREWRLVALPKTFVQMLPGRGPQWATDYVLAWERGTTSNERAARDWHVCQTSNMALRAKGHPCPRPLNGMTYLVGAFSAPGQTVLDPFMGSGTTLRAAKELGRKAIGIEIEEAFCEVAAKRMSQGVLDLGGVA